MKKILLFIFAVSFLIPFGFSQSYTFGPISIGKGGTYATNTDFWSSVYNQAGLAFIEKTEVGIGYDNKYLLKELSTKYIAAAVPLSKNGSLGISVSQFGFQLFNHTQLGLGYGMKLSESFAMGVNLDYLHLSIGDIYENKNAVSFQAGFLYQLNSSWRIGTHLKNPSMSKLSEYNDERFPTSLQLGCAFSASKNVELSAEIEKDIQHKPSLKTGIDYKLFDTFVLRAGIATNPTQAAFGFGLNLNSFVIDFASSYHEVLGFSPSTGIRYRFN